MYGLNFAYPPAAIIGGSSGGLNRFMWGGDQLIWNSGRIRCNPIPSITITPVDTNTAYIVVDAGATIFSHKAWRNNGGDGSTPASSIGTPFQPWEYKGSKKLASYLADPAVGIQTWSEDIGSQTMAIAVGATYGHSYHGGDVENTANVTIGGNAGSFLVASRGSSMSFAHTGTVDWGSGNTLTDAYNMTVNLDGTLSETISCVSTVSAGDFFVGMHIASTANYAEATFSDATFTNIVLPLCTGISYVLKATSVLLRDTATGLTIKSVSNAPAQSGYRATFVDRQVAGRSKLYYQLQTGVIGTVSNIQRTLSYGAAATGAAAFTNLLTNGDFASGLLTPWTATHNPGGVSIVANAMRFTRASGSDTRVNQAFTCTVGKLYQIKAKITTATVPIAQCALLVGLNVNGTTVGAVVNQAYSRYQQGEISVLFVATQTTHYAMALLLAGTNGQTVDWDDFTVYQLN